MTMRKCDRHKPGQGYTRYTPMAKPMASPHVPRAKYQLTRQQRTQIAHNANMMRAEFADDEVFAVQCRYAQKSGDFAARMVQICAQILRDRAATTPARTIVHTNTRPTYTPEFG